MSRTDKDSPGWVRSEWYEPCHTCAEHHGPRIRHHPTCDLPDEPLIQRSQQWRRGATRCHWIPAWEPNNKYGYHPPRWFVDHIWNSRVRAKVRDELRQAIAEFNATGEVTAVPNVDQHHHGAKWLWD